MYAFSEEPNSTFLVQNVKQKVEYWLATHADYNLFQ